MTVEAAAPTTYSFTINISDEESPINVGSYEEGDAVTYTFDRYFTEDQNQHWDQSITPSDLNYTFDPGSETYDEDAGEWITENASISFTMPASDVTFELVYVPIYEVTVNDESAGSYAEGSTVNISIPGPVDSITPNDLEYTYDSGTGDFSFTMPAQSVSIYTTAQIVEYDYNMYATDDPSDTTTIDTGSFESDGTISRQQNIDGVDVDFVTCTITASSVAPQLIGEVRYAKEADMQYIGTSTRCQLFVDNGSSLEAGQGYVTISYHQA